MCRRLWPLVLLVAGLIGLGASSVSAQTTDDFFNGDVLHEIRLAINSKDWSALRAAFEDNTYYPCDFTWNGIVVRNVGIRSRGSGSRSGTKPGLRVDFDRYASRQRFLGLKSVVLDNLTQDPSGMKERLATMFLAKLGQPASREAHARLYINNEYLGLYAIVESIDKDFLTRVFGENEGYLFEYNWVYEWRFGYLGDDLEPYRELFDIKTHESDSLPAIYRPLEQMVFAINDASDPVFEDEVGKFINLTDWTTHVALENAIAEWDGVLGYAGLNNFYLYRNPAGQSRFIAWDKDNAFRSPTYSIHEGVGDNVLARRVTGIPQYGDLYYSVLRTAADAMDEPVTGADEGSPTLTWLRHEIERIYAQTRESMRQDTVKPFTNDEFETSVDELRAFASERPAYLRCEVAKEVSRDSGEIADTCPPSLASEPGELRRDRLANGG